MVERHARLVASMVWALSVGALPALSGCGDAAIDQAGGDSSEEDLRHRRGNRDAGSDVVVPAPAPAPDAGGTPAPETAPPPDTSALAPCDQTLSAGANVASAVASASSGTTLCLNAGSYGKVTIADVTKTSDVTVRSTSGTSASLSVSISNSTHLKLQNLTIVGLEIDTNQQGGTKYVTVAGITFTGQAVVNVGNNGNAQILIDRSTFDGISACADCYEGRLQVLANPPSAVPSGVTVTRSHFGKAGESDGIQIGAYGVVVGPGNVFAGIVQGNYARHVDAIQLYGQSHTTIIGNYFVDNDVQIMAPDGGEYETFTDNVFIGAPGNNGIQLGSHVGDVFSHNTVKNITVSMDKKVENTTKSQNGLARDNLMVNSQFKTKDSGGTESCLGCTFDHNLFTSSGDARGTNNVLGTPLFVGGAVPTTWAGWQLIPTSPGHLAGSDGKDLGATTFGP